MSDMTADTIPAVPDLVRALEAVRQLHIDTPYLDSFDSDLLFGKLTKAREIADAALASRPSPSAADAPGVEEIVHPDDIAVDRFASAMKAKLAEKRGQGYRGWDDKADYSNAHLSEFLRKHVEKGDPVDVGNFAMMIHQRGERIDEPPALEPQQPLSAVMAARQEGGDHE